MMRLNHNNTIMDKINRFTVICLVFLAAVSCVDDFTIGDSHLQKPPGVDITQDTVFSNSEYAQRFLWNAYSTLYYGMPWDWSARGNKMNMGNVESMTDLYQSYLSWDYSNRNMYPGKYGASEESQHSKYHYSMEGSWSGIRKAYLFIENVGRVPDMSENLRTRLIAEAKMIIACHYADMYRHFGGLPLVRRAYLPTDVPEVDRSTARETLDFITDLCDQAEKELPWSLPAEEKTTWDGRFTGAAAIGLKIRMQLFAASPLFNDDVPYQGSASSCEANSGFYTWFGRKDPQMWQDVINTCEYFFHQNELDNNGGYRLYTDGDDARTRYRDAYLKRGTSEMLISTRVINSFSYNESFNYYIGPSAVPVLEYMDLFGNEDGTPFDNSVWDQETISPWKDPWANRDPRLYETCIVNGQPYQDRVAETWMGGRERGKAEDWSSFFTGAGNFKFGLDKKLANGKPAHWPYLRMAEIYLSYAEALNEAGRTGEAFQWVDAVRARVDLLGFKEAFEGRSWNQETFREELLHERSREFGHEEVRWFDQIRWKREQDFRKRLHGLRIERMLDENGNVVNGVYTHKKITLAKRYWQDGNNGEKFFDSKWYLSAFPLLETYKNYNLPQNPGW